jgi:hypothetical protein
MRVAPSGQPRAYQADSSSKPTSLRATRHLRIISAYDTDPDARSAALLGAPRAPRPRNPNEGSATRSNP